MAFDTRGFYVEREVAVVVSSVVGGGKVVFPWRKRAFSAVRVETLPDEKYS